MYYAKISNENGKEIANDTMNSIPNLGQIIVVNKRLVKVSKVSCPIGFNVSDINITVEHN